MAGEKAEEAEDDVDEQVGAAAGDDEHADWWDCGGVIREDVIYFKG
jgi:hypothetical protein